MFIGRRLLGPGHSTCKPLPVPTQDGPNRYSKFKVGKIRRDYWNVLCLANSVKLRKTALELINSYKPKSLDLKYLEFPEDYRDVDKSDQNLTQNSEFKIDQQSENFDQSSNLENDSNSVPFKTKGFWTVYSKRFKESIHLLSVSDIATILKSFHIYNKDTGEYVVAVLELKRRISEMDSNSLLDCLWILSRRLKHKTQIEFFNSLANHVPNVLYSFNCLDIIKVLWNLHNSGYTDVDICRKVYLKLMDQIDELSEEDLSFACLSFGRFGYRNMDLYSKIENRISKNCNADTLFKMAWGLTMASIDVTNLISERTETLINSLEDSPRWKVKVWKTILNGTNCKQDLKKTVEKYL